jgi:hypothetical protein
MVSSASGRGFYYRAELHTEAEITAAAKPIEGAGVGVYFLVKGGQVVYVGQSRCVAGRIATHHANTSRPFDSWSWLPCDKSQLDTLERLYITALVPEYNCDPITKKLRLRVRVREKTGEQVTAPSPPVSPLTDKGYKAARVKLSDTTVAALRCPDDRKDMLVFDASGTGLGVRITSAQKKIFLFQYRTGSKVHRIRLGLWPVLTASQAHLLVKARWSEVYRASITAKVGATLSR